MVCSICQHFPDLAWSVVTFQAVYTALKETESRATDLLPLWKVLLQCLRGDLPILLGLRHPIDV